MEDTLRAKKIFRNCYNPCVLILVLMEDTLRVDLNLKLKRVMCVLILVLMEDTLRVDSYYPENWNMKS